jgi:HEAT repeat protein
MVSAFADQVEPVLAQGLALSATLWLVLSSWVVVDRVRYDRHRRRVVELERALSRPALAALAPLDRSRTVRDMLSNLPTLVVYRMAGNGELPAWVQEICAEYSLQHIGLVRMLRDATPHRGPNRKWRRISALHALVHARPDSIHALLRVALADADADIASAAATVLQRLGDRRAAEILIGGLRSARLPASRIAARLERFPIPLGDLLRPLLSDSRPEARYWSATLLRNDTGRDGLAAAIVPLVNDADASVRKAALLTLGRMVPDDAARLATQRLSDAAPFVRTAAITVLAEVGVQGTGRARRHALASSIAPALADREWSVRTAAKDALVKLGPTTWHEVAAQLSSPDAFARNGAAEVLQNIGVLDWTLRGIASGVRPSDEAVDVLRRALREGGAVMASAAALRSSAEPIPDVDKLLRSLQLEEAAS